MRKRIRPADAVASLSTESRERSPAVDTRAAKSTSASEADDFTSSTVMSLRKCGVGGPGSEAASGPGDSTMEGMSAAMGASVTQARLPGRLGRVSERQGWEREIRRDALGIGLAVGTYGVSFGAVAQTSGLSLWQTVALSALAFTGGSQFAFVGVVGAGGSPFAGVAAALLLGARNLLYALRLGPLLAVRSPGRKAAWAHLVIDETTAMALAHDTPGPDRGPARLAFLATGFAVFAGWNIATLVGALGAQALGDPKAFGLDAAVGAAFLALLWPQLQAALRPLTAALSVVVALLLVPVAPAGVPVLAAGLVAVVIGWSAPRAGDAPLDTSEPA